MAGKYQKQSSAAGHTYKFVHEAFVDSYDTWLMACFRSKFEYKDGSTWRHAGEIIDERISSGLVEPSTPTSPPTQMSTPTQAHTIG